MKNDSKYHLCYAICLVFLGGVFVYVQSLEPAAAKQMMQESGWVERLSAIGYAVDMILFAVVLRGVKNYAWFLLMLLGMMARELDFHNAFTSQTTTSTRFYISPDVPAVEKILAVAVFGLLLYALIRVCITYLPVFAADLKKGCAVAVGVFLGVSLAAISKLIDGLGRKMAGFGIEITEQTSRTAGFAEEIMELGIPIMFAIAIVAAAKKQSERNSQKTTHQS